MRGWLKEQPDNQVIGMHLAGAYLSLNREDEARKAYAAVVEHHPENIAALNDLAWLSRNQDLASAIAHAEKAVQLAPTDATVMDTLGTLLTMRGDKAQGTTLDHRCRRACSERSRHPSSLCAGARGARTSWRGEATAAESDRAGGRRSPRAFQRKLRSTFLAKIDGMTI